jgi:riboflavin biosynthesis pyrimidine reductase
MLPRQLTAKLVGTNSVVGECPSLTRRWAELLDGSAPSRIALVNRQHTMFTQASVSLDGSVIWRW